ncbi:FAD/NAD(P)-binding protein [Pseudomonas putida]
MKTVAVIGGGFSGVATVVQLMRQGRAPVKVVLVERSSAFARGTAYGTLDPSHLLNVPAADMSAVAGEPESFLQYLEAHSIAAKRSSFLPRKVYGEYLAELLASSNAAATGAQFSRLHDAVVELVPLASGAQLRLASGNTIRADHVVLALGNSAPADLAEVSAQALGPHYHRDPWLQHHGVASAAVGTLVIGAGLTAVDIALSLSQAGPVYMLSRHGLLPHAHQVAPVVGAEVALVRDQMLAALPSVSRYLRVFRHRVAHERSRGVDWREVVAAVRPIVPVLWERLNANERKRFLRHVKRYWDIHRHRMAPQVHESLHAKINARGITPIAGRVLSASVDKAGVRVVVRHRNTGQLETLLVSSILNCTGPNSRLDSVDDAFICHLHSKGLIIADPCGLGVEVDEHLCVRNAAGVASPWLSCVGPMLRARYWEATAVPELRQHAANLAAHIVDQLACEGN